MKKIISLILLIITVWALGFAAFTASVIFMSPYKPTEKTDAIVVLTGGKTRIETALTLFSERLAPELFISGVHEHVTKDDLLSRHEGKPLPTCCVTIGYKATTTTENAKEVADWLKNKKIKTIRLVTSNYHMPRAILEFHRAIPGIKIIPHPVAQANIEPHDEFFWFIAFEEYHKALFRAVDLLLITVARAVR